MGQCIARGDALVVGREVSVVNWCPGGAVVCPPINEQELSRVAQFVGWYRHEVRAARDVDTFSSLGWHVTVSVANCGRKRAPVAHLMADAAVYVQKRKVCRSKWRREAPDDDAADGQAR